MFKKAWKRLNKEEGLKSYLSKDFGIENAGPEPISLLSRQDLEGSSFDEEVEKGMYDISEERHPKSKYKIVVKEEERGKSYHAWITLSSGGLVEYVGHFNNNDTAMRRAQSVYDKYLREEGIKKSVKNKYVVSAEGLDKYGQYISRKYTIVASSEYEAERSVRSILRSVDWQKIETRVVSSFEEPNTFKSIWRKMSKSHLENEIADEEEGARHYEDLSLEAKIHSEVLHNMAEDEEEHKENLEEMEATEKSMSLEEAKNILGDRAIWELQNMIRALSSMSLLNDEEENKRLEAAKVLLRSIKKSFNVSQLAEEMIRLIDDSMGTRWSQFVRSELKKRGVEDYCIQEVINKLKDYYEDQKYRYGKSSSSLISASNLKRGDVVNVYGKKFKISFITKDSDGNVHIDFADGQSVDLDSNDNVEIFKSFKEYWKSDSFKKDSIDAMFAEKVKIMRKLDELYASLEDDMLSENTRRKYQQEITSLERELKVVQERINKM